MNKRAERDAPRSRGLRNLRGAFTIVEIMVVVIIISVLATMIAPRFFGQIGKTKRAVAGQKIKAIESVVDAFYFDYGRMPESLDELVTRPADIAEENWQDPPIKAKELKDPWGRDFIYVCPGQHGRYDLCSLGRDGQVGGEKEDADITNW